jgi:hypothetical protein
MYRMLEYIIHTQKLLILIEKQLTLHIFDNVIVKWQSLASTGLSSQTKILLLKI